MISCGLEVHNDATADLRQIRQTDPTGFVRLAALLQQLMADPTLEQKLLTRDFGKLPAKPLSAKVWGSVTRLEKLQIWRLRAWELERHGLKYRLFYVYDYKRRTFVVIGVTPRDGFDYDDPQHPLRIRMVRCIRQHYRDT